MGKELVAGKNAKSLVLQNTDAIYFIINLHCRDNIMRANKYTMHFYDYSQCSRKQARWRTSPKAPKSRICVPWQDTIQHGMLALRSVTARATFIGTNCIRTNRIIKLCSALIALLVVMFGHIGVLGWRKPTGTLIRVFHSTTSECWHGIRVGSASSKNSVSCM